ncbi:cytochrome P450 [Aspergillus stella-maris]|uniref:cytochrome P450 n=1 Tax=Aspergillus stella-maris TaxID=1810926 RepID=UPI003CCCA06C
MGCALRFILQHPTVYARCQLEIDEADKKGLLSHPIRYEETGQHLPYVIACLKESARLHPSATNLFARVCPKGGKVIDGHYIPGETEISSHAYVVQRDPALYGADFNEYNPERWMQGKAQFRELDSAQFVFGMGPRTCLGKDVAMLEQWKLVPEILRQFYIEFKHPGKYIVIGGIAYNQGMMVKLTSKPGKKRPSSVVA